MITMALFPSANGLASGALPAQHIDQGQRPPDLSCHSNCGRAAFRTASREKASVRDVPFANAGEAYDRAAARNIR